MERQNTKEWLTAQWIEELKPKSTNICYFSRAQEGKRNLTDKDKCTSGLLQTNRKWTTTSSYPPWAFRKYLKGQKLTLSVDLIFLSTSTAKKGIKKKAFWCHSHRLLASFNTSVCLYKLRQNFLQQKSQLQMNLTMNFLGRGRNTCEDTDT